MSTPDSVVEPPFALHGPDVGMDAVLALLETPREWEQGGADLVPSGGTVVACPKREALPSGTSPWPFPYVIRGGAAFGFVMAASTLGVSGESIARDASDFTRVGARMSGFPAQPPRGRRGDAHVDAGRPRTRAGAPTDSTSAPAPSQSAAEKSAAAEARVAIDRLPPVTAQDQVRLAQDALGLSVTQLAEVLRVTRPTVYSYLNGSVDIPRDRETVQRLRDLTRVSTQFRARSAETVGGLIAAPLGDDEPSLFTLLKATSWDHAAIDAAIATLAQRVEARRKEREVEMGRPVTPETVELERLRLRLGSIS